MKFTIINICLLSIIAVNQLAAEPEPDDQKPPDAVSLLRSITSRFPQEETLIEGSLLVRKPRGIPIETMSFEILANWQPHDPTIQCTLYDNLGRPLEAMRFQPTKDQTYQYFLGTELAPAPLPPLTAAIQSSDISWMDLTLSFLWWSEARHVDTDRIRGYDCYVVQAFPPHDATGSPYHSVRLWISKDHGMLMQAEGLDDHDKPQRRLWVRALKEIDDAWMIKIMEIQQFPITQRTKLEIYQAQATSP